MTLITRDGGKLRVRLYGIDAPEVRHEKKPGQPYGEEAKRALAGKVLRKEVTITIQDRDQYKRIVGIIRIGNRNINVELLAARFQERDDYRANVESCCPIHDVAFVDT